MDIILVKGFSKHTLSTYFRSMKIDPNCAVYMLFLKFSIMFFSKFVKMTKTHSFSNFAWFCTPKRCTHVHRLLLTNNSNYVNFFTRMISNFKYKCPSPGPLLQVPLPGSITNYKRSMIWFCFKPFEIPFHKKAQYFSYNPLRDDTMCPFQYVNTKGHRHR